MLKRFRCWLRHREVWITLECGLLPFKLDGDHYCPLCETGGLRSHRARRTGFRVVAGGLAAGLLAGCSTGLPALNSRPPASCPELLVQAQTSPDVTIHGAYNCLDPQQQAEFGAHGITGDLDFRIQAAQAPVLRHYRSLGRTASGLYVFDLYGDADDLEFIRVNAQGKISGGLMMTVGGARAAGGSSGSSRR